MPGSVAVGAIMFFLLRATSSFSISNSKSLSRSSSRIARATTVTTRVSSRPSSLTSTTSLCFTPSSLTLATASLPLTSLTSRRSSSVASPVTRVTTALASSSVSELEEAEQPFEAAVTEATVTATATEYSPRTMKRVMGKDQREEFAKMAETMQVSGEELQMILKQRWSKLDPKSEKAEYIDWLLSPPTDKDSSTNGKKKKKSTTAAPPAKRAAPKPRAQPAPSKKASVVASAVAATTNADGGVAQTFKTDIAFADRPDLHPLSKRAITEVMGLSTMTEIQAKTFAAASTGSDVLGRARTGTGKTLAFLLPAIERVLKVGHKGTVGVLVISPTRELATQIGDQAEKLLTFHKKASVQVVFGGTNMNRDVTRLNRELPTILVATPGRLLDHMKTTKINGAQFGRDIMSKTPVVVLDETDRLLDMGFRNEIEKILAFLPDRHTRQTLLFSATIPPELKKIMAANMNKDFVEVDCINDGDAASHTNAQVKQSHIIVPFEERFVSSMVEIVRLAMQDPDHKIVVFFPTARMVAFCAEIFNIGLRIPVMELHSKKSQGYRNRVSDEFRNADVGVLFTSDVSARGVDYPNVSHVIQFGMADTREQYIHRLGRTGRAGTEGKGWLVLSEFEQAFLNELKGVEIPVDKELEQLFNKPISAENNDLMESVREQIRGGHKVLASNAKGAYQAFLGYYLGKMKRMKMKHKEDLVDIANQFAALTGLEEPPALTTQMVGKMGLKGIDGLNVSKKVQEPRGRPQNGNQNGRRSNSSNRGGGGGGNRGRR